MLYVFGGGLLMSIPLCKDCIEKLEKWLEMKECKNG